MRKRKDHEGAMMVGGSFLEKFIFSLRIKCLETTLSAAFTDEMTPEQYFDN